MWTMLQHHPVKVRSIIIAAWSLNCLAIDVRLDSAIDCRASLSPHGLNIQRREIAIPTCRRDCAWLETPLMDESLGHYLEVAIVCFLEGRFGLLYVFRIIGQNLAMYSAPVHHRVSALEETYSNINRLLTSYVLDMINKFIILVRVKT